MDKRVIVFIINALVVVADGFIKLVGDMISESQREVSVGVFRIQCNAFLILFNSVLVVFQLAVCMCEIWHYCLYYPAWSIVAELEGIWLHFLGFFVVALFVVDHTDLILDHGVAWVYFFSLLEGKYGCVEVICSQLLHTHIQMSRVAAWE